MFGFENMIFNLMPWKFKNYFDGLKRLFDDSLLYNSMHVIHKYFENLAVGKIVKNSFISI